MATKYFCDACGVEVESPDKLATIFLKEGEHPIREAEEVQFCRTKCTGQFWDNMAERYPMSLIGRHHAAMNERRERPYKKLAKLEAGK